jgi:hypothetical protein
LRPQAILPGADEWAYAICRFGFARLSSHDLDTAPPRELCRYSAPELLAGVVSPASDWWSLGVILLEKLTQGACFEGIRDQAFLMDVVANGGADIPAGLGEEARLLLRGLLAVDLNVRWGWEYRSLGGENRARRRRATRDDASRRHRAAAKPSGRLQIRARCGRAENWPGRAIRWRAQILTWRTSRQAGGVLGHSHGDVAAERDTHLTLELKILNGIAAVVAAADPGLLLQHPWRDLR